MWYSISEIQINLSSLTKRGLIKSVDKHEGLVTNLTTTSNKN